MRVCNQIIPYMSQTIEGNLDAKGMKFAIVVARFNSFVTDKLLEGALGALRRTGASDSDVEVVRVPGAWEIPLVVQALAEQKKYDAIIALGAVIRGDTPHFDYVAGECARHLSAIPLATGVPVAFGVLTTNSVEQAVDRAGAKAGNKGFDAALSAIEMVDVLRRLRG